MDIRAALKEQYHAGLAMLAQCVEKCPDDLWTAPNPLAPLPDNPDNPPWGPSARSFWRIVFHNVFFVHLYLGQDEMSFQPPPAETAVRRRKDFDRMWRPPWDIEPYELSEETKPCLKSEILEYISFLDGLIDDTVDNLDLDTQDSGFHWYKNITKLSHQLMSLRHLQGHVGQLSELLMLRGIDIDWTSKASSATKV